MKRLKDYANDITRCSKCGLCQAVCPLYKLSKNDCAVSKGKFIMLDGVIKGDLGLNKNIDKYLEMCLKCGKCSEFCPSGINVCEIFRTAKYEYLQDKKIFNIIKFMESEKVFDRIVDYAGYLTKSEVLYSKNDCTKCILFFRGCANKVNSTGEKALKKIISNFPYKIIEENVKCCGLPFASSGNLERYEEVKKYNADVINNSDCDVVITDCASCAGTLNDYGNINKPILNFIDFVASKNIKFRFSKKYRVTFHKPCHLKNYEAIKKVFENSQNLEYVEMEDYDECCGFAGQFALTNRKLSKELSKKKISNALATNPDIIVTSCPACILGLKQGLLYTKGLTLKPKIMNLTELLAKAEAYL